MSNALLGMAVLLRALEPIANGVLDLDVIARARLSALARKRLRLIVESPFGADRSAADRGDASGATAITLAFGQDRFTLHAGDTQPVDLEMRGTPRALLHALRSGDTGTEGFAVQAEGNLELLATFSAALRDLSPDLLAPLRAAVGADATSALHTAGAVAQEIAKRAAATAGPLLDSAASALRDIGAVLRRRRPGD